MKARLAAFVGGGEGEPANRAEECAKRVRLRPERGTATPAVPLVEPLPTARALASDPGPVEAGPGESLWRQWTTSRIADASIDEVIDARRLLATIVTFAIWDSRSDLRA